MTSQLNKMENSASITTSEDQGDAGNQKLIETLFTAVQERVKTLFAQEIRDQIAA
jgi:hypothetical protein